MLAHNHPYFSQTFTALAHRGGSLLPGNVGRENTLHAFGQAVALGYTHLETDVHATADGELVAFHDPELDRVTDSSGRIRDLTLEQVREARIAGQDQIPTLDEVVDAFPDSFLNIDIKSPSAIDPLVACLRRHGAQDRVCVGSFNQNSLQRFRRLTRGHVATSVGPVGVAWTARVPLLPQLLASPGLAFQMPEDHVVAGRRVHLLTPWLLDAAHRRGKVVHVWTINDAAHMHRLIDLGVDGIVTDAADVLKDVLVERDLWHHPAASDGEQITRPRR
ncbi:glycerophosphodiester phosphodiesterase [Luteococcus sp. Sow4_B9]|uniref:glycerophosphodiester phosphodiesterase n=1 Tax=Luteococcus sp. Sow4_B9 TaxID=3438792 RepID=UPI003F9C4CEF